MTAFSILPTPHAARGPSPSSCRGGRDRGVPRPSVPGIRIRAAWLLLLLLLAASPALAADAPRIGFADMYKSVGVLGMKFSDTLLALAGKPVAIRGYMAPPLKPEADFFVLTREPVSLCPFCQSDADWPADIIVVYLKGGSSLTSNLDPIEATGTLEIGSRTDPKTGFVSRLRLVEARWRRL
jgi:hypothetical protein